MKNSNSILIESVKKELNCNQKELAEKIGVSPTQISQWKKGEQMSFEKSDKLRDLIGLEYLDESLIDIVGSIENLKKSMPNRS